MALRKQAAEDVTDIQPESHRLGESAQEDDEENEDEFSLSLLPPTSARHQRRRERGDKSNRKDMTEEEMMDLALRLSEQEASVTASRLQQEEEAVMEAIRESMVNQTQACPPSQSRSLLPDAEAALRLCSRRRLLYPNAVKLSTSQQSVLQDQCPTESESNQEAKATGDRNKSRSKRQKRKDRSPLLETPELSQTQKLCSQASPCSSESLSVPPDSPQSSDSTQIDACQLPKSPVFPSAGCRAAVCVPRLSQELLESCKLSGFVSCTQDLWPSALKPLCGQPSSPVFPKSPRNFTAHPNSSLFLDTDQGDEGEMELSPERGKSPVFGRSPQLETSPRVCENVGFTFSSQESFTSTVRSTALRPQSPVFPGSPGLPTNRPAAETSTTCTRPVFSATERRRREQSRGRSTSPVFGGTEQRQVVRSAAELSEVEAPAAEEPPQSPRQGGKIDPHGRLNQISTSKTGDAREWNKSPKDGDWAETELTSDVTLLWSDEDDTDITPVGSPSPVFPEERPGHQAGRGLASLNRLTAADPEATRSKRSSRQGTAKRAVPPPGEPAGAPMVHYYWGVPFCPRGLDPDSYTKVILAQMEVYEKSLKQAQRRLVRKAEWGEPILPQPEKCPSAESPSESPQPHVPQRRGPRLRRKKLCESADTSPAEEEEEEHRTQEEQEKNKGGEDEEDADDCEVCPETQLSNSSLHDVTVEPEDGAQSDSKESDRKPSIHLVWISPQLRPDGPTLPEAQVILQDDPPAADQHQVQDELELQAPVDGDIPARSNVGLKPATQQKAPEETTDPRLRGAESPEPEPAAAAPSPDASMDCPICQGSFPVTEIEVHAAYCDGEVAVVDKRPQVNSSQTPPKMCRKRARQADVSAEDGGRNHEKCYVCHKAFALRDYSRHTELCIQQWAAKPGPKGNLLSALERAESRDSGAGPSRLQPGEVIELRDDEDDERDDVSVFTISSSPIRSFTPISEATDCLIDFKRQQRTKKPSKRRR